MTQFKSARILRAPSRLGAIAQLGERYTGSVEVGGSIPPGSTILILFLLGTLLRLAYLTTGESEGIDLLSADHRRPHRLEA